jgi:transcription elongation factor Elf1
MPLLTSENTNVLAHRVAGDTLTYECPNCDHGEVPVVDLIESADASCIDCGTTFYLYVEEA